MQNYPLVSVVTVVYNGVDTIERTVKSVIDQDYPNLEYVIIDGGSGDGTLDILKKYRGNIDQLIIESDDGLYDAMNKGIRVSSGDYLWFINAGDEVGDNSLLKRVFSNHSLADIYYGDTLIVNDNGQEIGLRRLKPVKNIEWKHFNRGMLIGHQAAIVSRSVASYYNLKYRFAADYEWLLLALKNSSTRIYTGEVMCRFLDGGLTKKNIVPGLKERYNIMVKYFGWFKTFYCHIPIAIKFLLYLIKHRRF
ncbi:glycosyltransferase family 2 protein [Marinilabiliaceae bacterium ANBcel2]|nr:glycosyltransferase family 2 protein [Marinilabiliaceae bacterium ANBcel2]